MLMNIGFVHCCSHVLLLLRKTQIRMLLLEHELHKLTVHGNILSVTTQFNIVVDIIQLYNSGKSIHSEPDN